MSRRLQNDETFPTLSVPKLGGGVLDLPAELMGSYGVVLVYRGHWCPFCNEQIAAFGEAYPTLSAAGIKVAAFSADGEADTAAFAKKHKVPFAIGHSADIAAIVAATGAYNATFPTRGHFLENTGFVLNPDGRVVTAVYSSRAIGRLVPNDVLRLVAFMRQIKA